MTMSYSSSSEATKKRETVLCFCRGPAILTTAWAKQNPGRRFWGCPRYNRGEVYCNMKKWFDPEMCARSKAIILELLDKKNKLKDRNGIPEEKLNMQVEVTRVLEKKIEILKEKLKTKDALINVLEKEHRNKKRNCLVYQSF